MNTVGSDAAAAADSQTISPAPGAPRLELSETWTKRIPKDRTRHKPTRAMRINPDHVEATRRALAHLDEDIATMIATSPDPGIVASDPDSAFGIAARLVALPATRGYLLRERFPIYLAEYILSEYPLTLATAVTVEIIGIELKYGRPSNEILRPDPDDGRLPDHGSVFYTLVNDFRRFAAGATEEDHAVIVAALEPYMDSPSTRHVLVAAYFVPERTDWADRARERAMVCSNMPLQALQFAATAPQLEQLCSRLRSISFIDIPQELVAAVERVGQDALPALLSIIDSEDPYPDTDTLCCELVGFIPTVTAAEALLERRAQEHARQAAGAAFVDFAGRFPSQAIQALALRASKDAFEAQFLETLVLADPDVAAQASEELDDETAVGHIRGILDRPRRLVADPADLPQILSNPPWATKRKRTKPVVIKDLQAPQEIHLEWLPGEREQWLSSNHYLVGYDYDESWQHLLDTCLSGSGWYDAVPMFLLNGPVDLLLPVIDSLPQPHNLSLAADYMGVALSRFGDPILPFVFTAAQSTPATLAQVLMPVAGPRIALFMVTAAAKYKAARPVATAWFARHPHDAALGLVPVALEKAGKTRKQAEGALLRLLRGVGVNETPETDAAEAQARRRSIILSAAETYGAPARDAIESLLDSDPLEDLPTRMPELPEWLSIASLPQLATSNGSTIGGDLLPNVLTIFALSTVDDPYAGLRDLREATSPTSLAGFARAMFSLWQLAGYPAKQSWILDAQGLVGDDETVRMLSPLIRAWPGESAHKRAAAGLHVLTAIGSDTALTHLNRIVEKVKFKALRTTARELIDTIAEERGLTPDELADRLVPDFGLSADGSRLLDYGPRQFTVGFDEALKPFVSQDGQRRKTLPKPGVKDDHDLADPAYAWFTTLKKEVRAAAGDQVNRLERAMIQQRTWSVEVFNALFLEHPFMIHLARRLVWVATTDSTTTAFRVAEDRTLADDQDEELVLADEAVISLAHPLTLDAEIQERMAELFADYEILQPFEQLGREVYELSEQEKSTGIIERFAGSTVATTKILALEKRGWARVAPEDAGIQSAFTRDLPNGFALCVVLDPGIIVGMPLFEDFAEQTLSPARTATSSRAWSQPDPIPAALADLDPVFASEMLRDLTWLNS